VEVVPGNPSVGGFKRNWEAKYSDFGPIQGATVRTLFFPITYVQYAYVIYHTLTSFRGRSQDFLTGDSLLRLTFK